MLQIFQFISHNRTLLLFLVLEFVALLFTLNTHSYHHSKYLSSSQAVSGKIIQKSDQLYQYFDLRQKNEVLVRENLELKKLLEHQKQKAIPPTTVKTDTLGQYDYIEAQVISNSYTKENNIITLNKGSVDGVKPDLGVILPNGIVGITLHVSKHYTTVLTLLSHKSSIHAKFKKNEHFGSLQWNGKTHTHAQLIDIPIQASVIVGDTIVSGGSSLYFPNQIPIGTISEIKYANKTFERLEVKLFADFSALHQVYIVLNKRKQEQQALEQIHLD